MQERRAHMGCGELLQALAALRYAYEEHELRGGGSGHTPSAVSSFTISEALSCMPSTTAVSIVAIMMGITTTCMPPTCMSATHVHMCKELSPDNMHAHGIHTRSGKHDCRCLQGPGFHSRSRLRRVLMYTTLPRDRYQQDSRYTAPWYIKTRNRNTHAWCSFFIHACSAANA